MFWVRRLRFSAPVKNPARRPCPASRSRTAQCARLSIRRHWLKITALRPWSRTICCTSWRSSSSLGIARPAMHALLGLPVADRRPDVLELELRQAVADDPLERQQAHQPEELGLGQRAEHGLLHQDDDRLIERVVLARAAPRSSRPARGYRSGAGAGRARPGGPGGPCSAGADRGSSPGAGRRPSRCGRRSRIACTGPSRHLGSSAMSSTHSTTEASSSIRFSIGVPVSTRR